MSILTDAHCHFFSTPFFAALGRSLTGANPDAPHDGAIAKLGWEAPGTAEALADRWAAELERADVSRAALIASVPGDSASVASAVRRHPERFVGFFMVDPTERDAVSSAVHAIDRNGLRAICLFPAMHRYSIHDQCARAMFDVAAARPGTAVFVHCGVLSVGVRRKLGLPSLFDIRLVHGLPLTLTPTLRMAPSTYPRISRQLAPAPIPGSGRSGIQANRTGRRTCPRCEWRQ